MTEFMLVAYFLALLTAGAGAAAILDSTAYALVAGRPLRGVLSAPLHAAALPFLRQKIVTECPDSPNWRLASAFYLALALLGLSLVPVAPGTVLLDLEPGIVLWGACETLTVVVVFLHGWSANSPFPLIGAYRYVATGLPVMLVSMFVLIAAALPAESLSVTKIVAAQEGVWNIVRQPLGLPLFLILGLSLTLRGPLDYADPHDLAGGTSAEDSGAAQIAWQCARLAMLVSVSAMASAVFLGGYLGPVLPGPLWLALKTALILVLLVAASHLLARMPPSRMLATLWLVMLPLSFLDLLIVGTELLL